MPALTLPTVTVMQPTLVTKPFHRPDWIYEEKIDGYRMVAYKDGDRVRLVSRQGKTSHPRFGHAQVAACVKKRA